MELSEHFSYEEAIASDTADRYDIDNTPDSAQLEVMLKTAVKMEKVRASLGNKSIHVNSWFRNLQLNRALKSKDSSQHLKGEAVDFICPSFGTPLQICKKLMQDQILIGFDQLILEHTWVHISFSILNGKPRGQVVSLLSNGGYAPGLTDKHGKPL